MRLAQIAKRAFDVVFAAILLTVTMPVLLAAAAAVLITEGRPIFYRSMRYVSKDRCISIYKFRTMVRDATSKKYRLTERFMRDGYLDIPLTCEVYTPIGRWLERTQIVELPQLLNIILHGMSFVGNRPLPASNVQLLRKYRGWEGRFQSPAGISGIAQIVGKLKLEPRERLALESAYSKVYLEGNILYCDIQIIWHTLALIIRGSGISIKRACVILRTRRTLARSARQGMAVDLEQTADLMPSEASWLD